MRYDDEIVQLTRDLTNAVNRAYAGGVEANDIINTLAATVAAIAISDGASHSGVAALFNHIAKHYQGVDGTVSQRIGSTHNYEHQTALSQATPG